MTQLQKIDTTNQMAFSQDQIDLIKRTMAKGATDDELQLFLHQAQRTCLDPLAKQIYFTKRKSKTGPDQVTIITGIDGYRCVAARTGLYAGNDDPIFEDGTEFPKKATATVYKIVQKKKVSFTASARWSEYYPGDRLGFMWKKMPHTMLGKCAEALAIRKAFPAELSGIYTKDEMTQADKEVTHTPKPKPQLTTATTEDVEWRYDQTKDDHVERMIAFLVKNGINEGDIQDSLASQCIGMTIEEIKSFIGEMVK